MKKIVQLIICLLSLTSDVNEPSDMEKYLELETKDVASIKKSDLPPEFSDESFKIVDDFIRKTKDLDYEILLFLIMLREK